MNDLVSIYIPTKNRRNLLKRAITSCINQTYENIEIIVIDDHSTDDTWSFLELFSNVDKRIKIFQQLDNSKGACCARNLAIEKACGEWVTGLDDDDYFLPHRIDDFVKYARNNREASFLCSTSIEMNEFGFFATKKTEQEYYINLRDIKRRNYVGNQIFISIDKLKSVGGFDELAPAWQDYDLWIRLIKKFGACIKINNYSLVLNCSFRGVTITNTSNVDGYRYFTNKHNLLLSQSDLEFQKINKLVNGVEKISIFEVIRHLFDRESFIRLVMKYLNQKKYLRYFYFVALCLVCKRLFILNPRVDE